MTTDVGTGHTEESAGGGGETRIEVRGEELWLLPARALWWPARRMLVVADTHFGKGSLLRDAGLAVPRGPEGEDRVRLTTLVRRYQARALVVLGDFLHGPLAPDDPECAEIEAWRASLAAVDVVVVAGNHDRGVRRRWLPPVEWREAALCEGPFQFVHDDADPAGGERLTDAARPFTLSGHVHPVVWLGSPRRRGPRVPVFWRRRDGLVLPSFGRFTGGWTVRAAAGDMLYAVGPERVVPIGRLT